MTYHHGVEVKETTKLTTLIRDINTSVIGVVCTGDDADAEQFPLDTPVLITSIRSVLGKAGKTGTLYKTLKAISDQCSPKVIVISVRQTQYHGLRRGKGKSSGSARQLPSD